MIGSESQYSKGTPTPSKVVTTTGEKCSEFTTSNGTPDNLLRVYQELTQKGEERKQELCKNLENDVFSVMASDQIENVQVTPTNLTQTSSTSHTNSQKVTNVYYGSNAIGGQTGGEPRIYQVKGQGL